MAVNWNAEEIKKINDNSLGDLKPYYYDSISKSNRQIDDDMEGYLILQTKDLKKKILDWIKNITKIETNNIDRDTILQLYFKTRLDDAAARIEEIDIILNKYADLQGEMLAGSDDPSRFAGIVDLNLMIRSISKMVDSIVIQRDQAFHEQNLTTILNGMLNTQSSDNDTQQELKSWQTVVSTYPGQAASSAKKSGSAAVGTPVF